MSELSYNEACEIRARMCKSTFCSECQVTPLRHIHGSRPCSNIIAEYPKEIEPILIQWAEDHPVPKEKTYRDDFFEKYPNAPHFDYPPNPNVCPVMLGYEKRCYKENIHSPGDCKTQYTCKYWDKPLESSEKK